MAARSPDLDAFLIRLQAALNAGAAPGSAPARATARAFAALATPGPANAVQRETAPVCRHLAAAYANAAKGAAAALAADFARIEPRFAWKRRFDRKSEDPHFLDNHANATIVGEDGLEQSDRVRMGVSLLAPNTFYPDHRHPPEEVYIALSAGSWRQNDGPWRSPGPGGLIYNPPDIVHAMQAGDTPLLAIWTLPLAASN